MLKWDAEAEVLTQVRTRMRQVGDDETETEPEGNNVIDVEKVEEGKEEEEKEEVEAVEYRDGYR